MEEEKENREDHCDFKVLNSAGRCIADCGYNRISHFKRDCLGHTGIHHSEGSHEVQLTGRRIDDDYKT